MQVSQNTLAMALWADFKQIGSYTSREISRRWTSEPVVTKNIWRLKAKAILNIVREFSREGTN
ncbi:MAG: hypothetical protein ACEQSB_06255 [Undibacterium sp.]